MVDVTICIGSSCHLKGSREIVGLFQELVDKNNLSDSVELKGSFCMGNCVNGVNVVVDGERFSVLPDTAEQFFNENILPKAK